MRLAAVQETVHQVNRQNDPPNVKQRAMRAMFPMIVQHKAARWPANVPLWSAALISYLLMMIGEEGYF